MNSISLVHVKARQKVRVVEIRGGAGLENRLMSMGIYIGRELTRLSNFAMRGPVMVRVGRSVLALGHGMASKIMVKAE